MGDAWRLSGVRVAGTFVTWTRPGSLVARVTHVDGLTLLGWVSSSPCTKSECSSLSSLSGAVVCVGRSRPTNKYKRTIRSSPVGSGYTARRGERAATFPDDPEACRRDGPRRVDNSRAAPQLRLSPVRRRCRARGDVRSGRKQGEAVVRLRKHPVPWSPDRAYALRDVYRSLARTLAGAGMELVRGGSQRSPGHGSNSS